MPPLPYCCAELLYVGLLCSTLATAVNAQTGPPDESLTDNPGVEALNERDSTDILTAETVRAASPGRILGIFPRRQRDSAYVDTLGVGFFNKILAPTYPNPERSAALSFILPGSGQIYNKRFAWLKVPIIYGLYGALIYNGEFNRERRNRFATAYDLKLQGLPHRFSSNPRLDSERILLVNRNNFDKNFQLSYIGIAILHLVQTLEAYTTAHLLEFDMDESLTVAPVFVPPPPMGGEPVGTGLAIGATWRFGASR